MKSPQGREQQLLSRMEQMEAKSKARDAVNSRNAKRYATGQNTRGKAVVLRYMGKYRDTREPRPHYKSYRDATGSQYSRCIR